jgi:hypothetical protein
MLTRLAWIRHAQVLAQIYEKGEEVPLIAMYRKELAGELLSMREEDKPGVSLLFFFLTSSVAVMLACSWGEVLEKGKRERVGEREGC